MNHIQNKPCYVELQKLETMEEVLTSNDSVVDESAPDAEYTYGPPVEEIETRSKSRSTKVTTKYKVCPICTRRFPNRPSLHDHMQYHDYLSYQCPHCPSLFATFRGMARHRCNCPGNSDLLPSSTPTLDTSSRLVPLTEDKAVQVHFKLKFKRRSSSMGEPDGPYRKLRSARQHAQPYVADGVYTIVNSAGDGHGAPDVPTLVDEHHFEDTTSGTNPATGRKRKSLGKEKILKRDLPGLKYFDLMANVEKLKLLYFMQNENGRFCCPMCGKESSKSVGALNHIRMHPDLAPILEYYTACSEGSCLTNWDPLPPLPPIQVPEPKVEHQEPQATFTDDATPAQCDQLSALRNKPRASSLRKTRRVRRPFKWSKVLEGVTKTNPHECFVCQQVFHRPFGIATHYLRCHRLDMQTLVNSHIFDGCSKDSHRPQAQCCDKVDDDEGKQTEEGWKKELEELEGNLNTVLGCMVKDEEVLHELGWPVRDVEHLLADILNQCGQDQCLDVPRDGEGEGDRLERLRSNVGLLLKVCIQDAAMVTYGWDTKPVDEVLKEMLMASEISMLVK